MSIRASEKCTREEAIAFRDKVWEFLEEKKLPYEKVIISKRFGGEAKVYTGKKIETMPLRRSFRVLAFKNPKGVWEGDLALVKERGLEKSTTTIRIGEKSYHQKEIPEYFSVYRENNWKEESEKLKRWLLERKK